MKEVMVYVMWLVRESCPSARKHGAAFLATSFQFPAIVDLADNMDGVALLLDVIDSLGLNRDSYTIDRQVSMCPPSPHYPTQPRLNERISIL